MKNLIFFLVLW